MRVLFLCTGNSARSQMAEGWGRRLATRETEVHSAGTLPSFVNPHAIAVMAERDVDIRRQRSKGLDEVPETADVLVTLCSDAAEVCPSYPGAARVEHWNLEDPSWTEGGTEAVLEAFRKTRDRLEGRIRTLFAELGCLDDSESTGAPPA